MASPRQSALAERHKTLGSPMGDWNGMDVAWEYAHDVNLEHQAIRSAAALFDVSGLKKIHITGRDAMAIANHVCTRDLTQLYPGKSMYALILNEEGKITDDCIMFYLMPNHILMVHGGGTGMEQLRKSAQDKEVKIIFDDDLHNISLQGPKAVELLNQYTPYNLLELKYFHHVATTLFDKSCLLSRTGYSGERGYEIFAKGEDITHIWDHVLEYGNSLGIIPASFNCIDMIRVEAGLLFYPFDMDEADTPWDVGLGFAVSKDKAVDYRGKQSCMASIKNQKTKTWGVIADTKEALEEKAELYIEGEKVGYVTASCFSTVMDASIAMVRINKEYATPGISLDIKSEIISCAATTGDMPLYNPDKSNRTT